MAWEKHLLYAPPHHSNNLVVPEEAEITLADKGGELQRLHVVGSVATLWTLEQSQEPITVAELTDKAAGFLRIVAAEPYVGFSNISLVAALAKEKISHYRRRPWINEVRYEIADCLDNVADHLWHMGARDTGRHVMVPDYELDRRKISGVNGVHNVAAKRLSEDHSVVSRQGLRPSRAGGSLGVACTADLPKSEHLIDEGSGEGDQENGEVPEVAPEPIAEVPQRPKDEWSWRQKVEIKGLGNLARSYLSHRSASKGGMNTGKLSDVEAVIGKIMFVDVQLGRPLTMGELKVLLSQKHDGFRQFTEQEIAAIVGGLYGKSRGNERSPFKDMRLGRVVKPGAPTREQPGSQPVEELAVMILPRRLQQ